MPKDERLWTKCEAPLFRRRTVDGGWTDHAGQTWRRKINGKWTYQQEAASIEESEESQW